MFRRLMFPTTRRACCPAAHAAACEVVGSISKTVSAARMCASSSSSGASTVGSSSSSSGSNPASTTLKPNPSINNVTLVGVVHDINQGFVYEDRVTQFVVTTTSIDTTNPAQECVVEKDHHTVRCFGDSFAEDVAGRIKEGAVVCVSGRLRLNPQLEPSCNKHFYFPFVHVQPPFGNVALVHGDRKRPPAAAADEGSLPTTSATGGDLPS